MRLPLDTHVLKWALTEFNAGVFRAGAADPMTARSP